MLEVQSLSKKFGELQALKDLSFTVNDGEIVGFVGANGAGKSTAMRITLGMLLADSGQVLFNGEKIDNSNRNRIGYMPEERGLYSRQTLIRQLKYFGQLHGLSAKEAEKSALKYLEMFGLLERAKQKADKLSLGNQQRVQLAVALLHNPELLILDEPFSGLDPLAVAAMNEVLLERTQRGGTVLFSSHQLDIVERLCDRIVIISAGKLVAQGTLEELQKCPTPDYAVCLLNESDYASAAQSLNAMPEVVSAQERMESREHREHDLLLTLADDTPTTAARVLQQLNSAFPVRQYRLERKPLSEIYASSMQGFQAPVSAQSLDPKGAAK